MFSKKGIASLVLILLLCGISIVSIFADLNFNILPTVTCPDDGATFTWNEYGDSQNFWGEWDTEPPRYAQTHIESTVTGFGQVVLKFRGEVPGYSGGRVSRNGSVGSWGTFLGFQTSRNVYNHPVVGTVMETFPTEDGTYSWSGNGSIKLTPMIWHPSSSGFWTWGGSWDTGDTLQESDSNSGSWRIRTVYH